MNELREKGTDALKIVLTSAKNVQIIEKAVNTSSTEETYKRNLYQTIGHIIQSKNDLPKKLASIKDGKLGWNAPEYDSVKAKLQEHDDFLVNPFETKEGVVECRNCRDNPIYADKPAEWRKTWATTKQTRSGDEALSVFCRCANCGANWREA